MGALLPMVGAFLEELVLLLRSLHNQISSSALSSVARRHIELRSLGSLLGDDKKLIRLSVTLGVPRERLDYWQVRCRTS